MEQMKTLRTGNLIETDGGQLSWTELRDGKTIESQQELRGSLVELDRLGLWQTADGEQGSSLLLSHHETDFPKRADTETTSGPVDVGRKSLFRGDITWLFLWLILFVLIIESYLFHRHSVY